MLNDLSGNVSAAVQVIKLMNTTCRGIAYVSSNCTFLFQCSSLLTTIVIIVASGSSVMMDSTGQMDLGSLDEGKHCSRYANNHCVYVAGSQPMWLLRMSKREKKY